MKENSKEWFGGAVEEEIGVHEKLFKKIYQNFMLTKKYIKDLNMVGKLQV